MDYDPFMDVAMNLLQDSPGPLVVQEGSYAYQTTIGHGAQHVQSSHVSPEEGC
jgi:hypothetical protein